MDMKILATICLHLALLCPETGSVYAGEAEVWTLARLIAHAQTNSPDARIAVHRMRAARSGIEQANAALWPQLQLQSSYTRTDNPMQVFGSLLNQRAFGSSLDFNHVPDVDNLNLRGVLTYPLYTGGRTRAGREGAKARSEMVEAQAEQVRHTLAFEVARTFYTVQKARSVVEVAEAGLKSFEGHLQVARQRLQSGAILRSEVLDLQVRVAQAREELVRSRNAHAIAEHALRNLLGMGPGALSLEGTVMEPSPPADGDASRRPEWRVIQALRRSVDQEVLRAKAGFQPRVSAFGSLDSDSGWKTDGNGRSYTAGLMVQWDVWDGKLTQSRVAEARANADAIEEQEQKLRLSIDFELAEARVQLEGATERLAVSVAAIAQAEESVALSRARFEQGLALSLQLTDAQTALTTARVRQVEARADQRIAIAALRRALGLSPVAPVP